MFSLVPIVSVALGVASVRTASPAEPVQETKAKKFSHADHVPRVWYTNAPAADGRSDDPSIREEVRRDCRGCHDFGELDAAGNEVRPPRSPADSCFVCHDPERMTIEVDPVTSQRLLDGLRPKDGFDHREHDALACRDCHTPTARKDDFGGDTGLATCVSCHSEDGDGRVYDELFESDIAVAEVPAKFAASLDAKVALKGGGVRTFRHLDHLKDEELADPSTCSECHTDVRTSDVAALAANTFTDASCAECHEGNEPGDVEIVRDERSRVSIVALTFSHADHLSDVDASSNLCLDAGLADLEAQDCLACHVHESKGSGADEVTTFFVKPDREGFLGCMSCHDGARGFEAESHGQWGNCKDCHAFGADDLKTDRPVVAVDRTFVGDVRFFVPSQKHPGLGGAKDADCIECHLGPMPESPSRVTGARFEHASHLGPNATKEDCLACHTGIERATASTSIGLAWMDGEYSGEPGARLTFDMAACDDCHPGIVVQSESIRRRERRDVPAFDHAKHLAAAADLAPDGAVTCASCHDVFSGAANRLRDVGVKAEARACTVCHGHDSDRAARTAGLGPDRVGGCATCHVGGYPETGAQLEGPRAYASLAGDQVHPVTKRDCWECHIERPALPFASMADTDAAFGPVGRHPGNVHTQQPCHECHWAVRTETIAREIGRSDKGRAADGNRLEHFR